MQAIILKKNIFSEGNEIITMYTRELGKVRAVARSIKSPKSKLSFGLQNLFYTDVDILISRKLSTIKGVKPINAFPNIYSDSEKIALALFASEIIIKSTADEQVNEQLFDLFLVYLEHLNAIEADQSQELGNHLCADFFALQALAANGYALDFEHCAVCTKDLNADEDEKIFFSNRKNGFVCDTCSTNISDAHPIQKEMYLSLAANQHQNFSEIDSQKINPSQLHRLVQSFVEYILERNLNAGSYLGTLK